MTTVITRLLTAVITAAGGNFLLGIIPWPRSWISGFEQAMEPAAASGEAGLFGLSYSFLVLTLVLAPLAEEALFRRGIYGFIRRRRGIRPAALLSALAFGIYHGNWLQGIYGFMMGLVLAWGYETAPERPYAMAVLMHSAANLAVLILFGG